MPARPVRLAAVVFAALGLLTAGGCRSSSKGYGAGTEAVYLRACNPGRDRTQEPVCRCAYDEIRRTIPFDRYRALDDQLAKDPSKIPEEITRIVADCASQGKGSNTPDGSDSSDGSDGGSDGRSGAGSNRSGDRSSSSNGLNPFGS
jgi:hypothetical protein